MKTSNKSVIIWLNSGYLMISLMVIIGGITRLTHSGLSMVEWKPITGIIPPLTESEWTIEFQKYQQSPEFIHKHSHFTLTDFKNIFFWEYLHRLLARLIGVLFLVSFIYFSLKGMLKPIRTKVYLILVFGAFQGFLGWFMVKSGLVDNPEVSHFRLASHLLTALLLISLIFYTSLSFKFGTTSMQINKGVKNKLIFLTVLILIQITYGAFVSGMKAGLFFNTFPKMGEEWFPQAMLTSFNESGFSSFIENIASVQFLHRVFGITLLLVSIILLFYFKKSKFRIAFKRQNYILFFLIFLQFILGIFTLLFKAPITLAIIHQFMAILIVLQITKVYYLSRNQISY